MMRYLVALCMAFICAAVVTEPIRGGTDDRPRNWVVDGRALAGEAAKLGADSPWQDAPFFTYVVPAISSVRRLPDTLPVDGELSHQISLVGALGQYMPASFVVAPLRDVEKLALEASALTQVNGQGRIAPGQVDIKVVKTWWGPGTVWSSYFGDPSRRELVPDLLLHDENLVKVDLENQENYLRVDYPQGSEYVWISYHYPNTSPERTSARRAALPIGTRFDYMKEPVEDSPVLLPVVLEKGSLKQFWVTVHIPEDAQPGIYEGSIALTADGAAVGKMQVRMRVLPFALPAPRTYFDINRPFIVTMDGMGSLNETIDGFDGDVAMAKKRLRNLYKNQREHGMYQFWNSGLLSYNRYHRHREITRLLDDPKTASVMRQQLELIHEAGFQPPLIDGRSDISARVDTKTPEGREAFDKYIKATAGYMDLMEEILGHRDLYIWGRGEPSRAGLLEQLEGFEALHEIGAKIGQEGKPWHYPLAGYAEDLVNLGGQHYDRQYTQPWHLAGQRVLSYASPHPGAANPETSRRHHGLMLYKAGFDGTKNNVWISERQNWLSFWNPYGYHISIIYPTQTDVIDTLAWEGFREGIDDIRYATKLKQVALNAIEHGSVKAGYAAKRALIWLETKDEKTADLNAMRLEIISRILIISDLMRGVE